MDEVTTTLTVFFEAPFWVGVFERTVAGKLSACRVMFGAEPKEYDIYALILAQYHQLSYSPTVEAETRAYHDNPKRMQREAHRQTQQKGVGTKAQQALKLQQEQQKITRKALHRARKAAVQEARFAQKQQKRKQKHRGH